MMWVTQLCFVGKGLSSSFPGPLNHGMSMPFQKGGVKHCKLWPSIGRRSQGVKISTYRDRTGTWLPHSASEGETLLARFCSTWTGSHVWLSGPGRGCQWQSDTELLLEALLCSSAGLWLLLLHRMTGATMNMEGCCDGHRARSVMFPGRAWRRCDWRDNDRRVPSLDTSLLSGPNGFSFRSISS